MYRRTLLVSMILVLLLGICASSMARPRFALAYWREMGAAETGGCLYMRIWVIRHDGVFMPDVSVVNQNGTLLGETEDTGRVDVGFDVVSQPLYIQVRDRHGYQSDLTPIMTTERYPDYGHYAYEMLFVLKSDQDSGGVFDTRIWGTVNQPGEVAYDAPCTQSLDFCSTDPLDRSSDGFGTTTWADSHGQTFVAQGDRVRAVLLHGVTGGASNLTFNVDVMEGGPTGAVIATKTTANHSSIDPWMVGFGENECPVTPGQTYYLRMTREGGLSAYAMFTDTYDGGTYYKDGIAAPGNDIRGLVCCERLSPGATCRFSGVVRDANGQPIPDAVISVESSFREVTSEADGSYTLSWLLPDTYTLTAWKQGYTAQTIENLSVELGENVNLDFDLYPLSANALQNPGFEVGVLTPWTKSGLFEGIQGTGYMQVPSHSGLYWVGHAVQNSFGFGNLYQTVPVVPGAVYTASCFIYTDCYEFMRLEENPENCTARIGLDPTGGTNSSSSTIIWTPLEYTQGKWSPIRVSARATGPTMTVFTNFWENVSYYRNVVVFDDFHIGTPNASGALEDVLDMPDGSYVCVFGQVSTAATAEVGGAFYMEETDRMQGIRVQTSESVARGQEVSVSGALATIDGERAIVADSVAVLGTADVPNPLGLSPGDVGGASFDCSGLLVRTWGKVVSKAAGVITISDGDEDVKVYTSVNPVIGQYIGATGVVGCELDGQSVVRVVRCRTAGDVSIW